MAQLAIDSNDIVVDAFVDSGTVPPEIAARYAKIISSPVGCIGWKYEAATGQFSPPVARAALPTLVITGITGSNAASMLITSMSEVTCPVGTTLTAQLAVHDATGALVPLTASFRMPLKARDGRERVLLVSLTDGTGTITAPIQESGVWQVSQDLINEALPAAEQMVFAGITIYATL